MKISQTNQKRKLSQIQTFRKKLTLKNQQNSEQKTSPIPRQKKNINLIIPGFNKVMKQRYQSMENMVINHHSLKSNIDKFMSNPKYNQSFKKSKTNWSKGINLEGGPQISQRNKK